MLLNFCCIYFEFYICEHAYTYMNGIIYIYMSLIYYFNYYCYYFRKSKTNILGKNMGSELEPCDSTIITSHLTSLRFRFLYFLCFVVWP